MSSSSIDDLRMEVSELRVSTGNLIGLKRSSDGYMLSLDGPDALTIWYVVCGFLS